MSQRTVENNLQVSPKTIDNLERISQASNRRETRSLGSTAKAEVTKMQRLVFGPAVNTAARLGVQGDAALIAIVDW